METTSNQRIVDTKPLPSPEQLASQVPLSDAAARVVAQSRNELAAAVHGADKRPLVIVGPCSIHDPEACFDYAQRLQVERLRLASDLQIVMRVYFEKPRTTVGWKGLINDPDLDDSCDIPRGLLLARRVLATVLQLGMPTATELLDPIVPQYLAGLVSWAAIGARTTESPTHREMASGLSMPVGFKNGTDGSLKVAVAGIMSASTPHSFLGIDDEGRVGVVRTRGNPNGHLVLRGGDAGPNYDAASVAEALRQLRKQNLPERVLIDCSHGNSRKNYELQTEVVRDVAAQIRSGNYGILGVMIESHLVAGRQDLPTAPVSGVTSSTSTPTQPVTKSLVYGQSITDACLDFATTRELLDELAFAARKRA